MPRNSFSLTVGVGCEINIVRIVSLFLKVFNEVFLSFYYRIFRFKVI